MSGRVAIVYPRSNIDSVPCLIGAVELLGDAGYEVDLLMRSQPGAPLACFNSPKVHVRWLGADGLDAPPAALRDVSRRLRFIPSLARAPLARGYAVAAATVARGSRAVAEARARGRTYDCVIGVDPDGLVLAHGIAAGAPVAYFSLELMLSYELRTPEERALKARERTLSREAAFLIVQDPLRGRLLSEDNNLDPDRLVFVPNSPRGRARRTPSRYWHDRFGLSTDARIVLHAGSLGSWTGVEHLVEAAPSWPEPWVFVIHTRYDAESSPYVEKLRAAADPRRVYFSLKPVAREDYDTLIDAADVGVGFYIPSADSAYTQRNIQTIGLSSGKLAYFLRAGKPVIVNDATSLAAMITERGCGVAVPDAAAVAAALDPLDMGYEAYAERACAFFDAELQFEPAFQRVIERLERVRSPVAA